MLLVYGNVVVGIGKIIMDFIEVVVDVSVVEFEWLKEFGIKVVNEGDMVIFCFRGVIILVKNNFEEI